MGYEFVSEDEETLLAVEDESPFAPRFWFKYLHDGTRWHPADIDGVSYGNEILRLAARVRELEAKAEIDRLTIEGVLENRDAVRGIKEQLSRDVAALEGALQQAMNERDALAERVKLLDRLEEEAVRPAFEKIASLEEENRRLRTEIARRDRLDNPLAKPFDR